MRQFRILLVEQRVEQGGLADVGAAEERDLGCAGGGRDLREFAGGEEEGDGAAGEEAGCAVEGEGGGRVGGEVGV